METFFLHGTSSLKGPSGRVCQGSHTKPGRFFLYDVWLLLSFQTFVALCAVWLPNLLRSFSGGLHGLKRGRQRKGTGNLLIRNCLKLSLYIRLLSCSYILWDNILWKQIYPPSAHSSYKQNDLKCIPHCVTSGKFVIS